MTFCQNSAYNILRVKNILKKRGQNMKKFSGKASRLAWELFKHTGEIGYYMLYANIENAPDLQIQQNLDQGLER